jgi:hypothetical protein
MSKTPLAIVLLLALLVAACGKDGTAGQAHPARTDTRSVATASATPSGDAEAGHARRYTREQVIEALRVTRGADENGVENSDPRSGCFASKIFVTPDDNMAAYIQIGDPVATNPSGAVGVTIGTYAGVSSSKCLRIFKRRLAKLR